MTSRAVRRARRDRERLRAIKADTARVIAVLDELRDSNVSRESAELGKSTNDDS